MLTVLCVIGMASFASASTHHAPGSPEVMGNLPVDELAEANMRDALAQTTSYEFDAAAMAGIGRFGEEGVCEGLVPLARKQVDRDARSLMAHYVLSRCEIGGARLPDAEQYATRLPLIIAGMERPDGVFGDGKLIVATSFVDCIAYAVIGGWHLVTETMEIANGGRRLYYKAVARRDGDERDSVLRFDLSDYAREMIAAISTQFPQKTAAFAREMPALYYTMLMASTADAPSSALVGFARYHSGLPSTLITPQRRRELLEKAAAAGDPYAEYLLGVRLLLKSDDAGGRTEALGRLEKASAAGVSDADVLLAAMHARGVGVAASESGRRKALERAERRMGKARAEYAYAGVLADDGLPVADMRERMRWLRRAADDGYPPAQNDYGVACRERGEAESNCSSHWYEKAAAQGNAISMCNLGDLYLAGRGGVDVDATKAREWYERAIAGGNIACESALARMYQNGTGVARDAVRAREGYRRAAEWGDATAQDDLAKMMSDGSEEGHAAEAFEWSRRSARQGNLSGITTLAGLYELGLGVEKDVAMAAALYAYAAERGFAHAQYQLCAYYANGMGGLEKDFGQSVQWCRKAAEQGHGDAMSALGYAYANGEGVEKDSRLAMEWYRKGAEAGSSQAEANLGISLRDGIGVEPQPKLGLSWLERAAEHGHADAANSVGLAYLDGKIVTADPKEAVRWFERGAALGQRDAMTNLAGLLLEGNGVTKDRARAVSLLEKASAAGSALATCSLGEIYEEGVDGSKDEKKAVELFEKAADAGNVFCQVHMGERLAEGIGIAVDLARASAYLESAAQQGSTHAKIVRAMILSSPDYADRDVERSRRMLEELANAGDMEAQQRLGFAFQVGRLGRKDPVSARVWYERAAAQGATDAAGELGLFYAYGVGVERDYDAAVGWLEKTAEKTAEFSVELARLYVHRGELQRAADLFARHVGDISALGKHLYGRLCLEHPVCALTRPQAQAYFDAPASLDAGMKNQVAWFLSVFPTADRADGEYSVALLLPEARKRGASWMLVGTLAAAYARSGDFANAVATQKRANDMQRVANRSHPENIADGDSDAMLRSYQQGRPWEHY